MSSGHGDRLFVPGSSFLHRLPPQCKIASMVLFVFAVVATPREQFWGYGIFAAVVVALASASGLSIPVLARRLTIELPFVAFAFLLPFVAGGPRRDIGPVSASIDGLWGAWNILAKGTIGVGATLVLTATTSVPDLIRGLERLRLPSALIAMLTFMVRYADVITSEMQRMRIARLSRGHDPRWLWQVKAVAHSAGTLFVRSYERGERVFLAMQSRGYDGQMPSAGGVAASTRHWMIALALPAAATMVVAVSWLARS
ncbi:MAG: cobalt ECF transporter T component CbiQ [Acidimicrobiia bacterium]|nr:cobalt ECF transporter T component CbiQ [Acidimicrobiia bacterium]